MVSSLELGLSVNLVFVLLWGFVLDLRFVWHLGFVLFLGWEIGDKLGTKCFLKILP